MRLSIYHIQEGGEYMGKKKSTDIVSTSTNAVDDVINSIKDLRDTTEQMIQDGLNKDTAGTGTLMSNLHGASEITATLSNIGGGSVSTGGGGMKQGLNVIQANKAANGFLAGVEASGNSDEDKIADKGTGQTAIEEKENE